MAVASRQYYYEEEYGSGGGYRTPPLSVVNMNSWKEDAWDQAPVRPAKPIIRPYVVPDNPVNPEKPARKKRTRVDAPPRRFRYAYISAKEKATTIIAILVIGAIFLSIILYSSYCAYMQNQVNVTNRQIAAVQEDIDSLRANIEKGNNITSVEKEASKKLGMVYPSEDQIVYLGDVSEAEKQEEGKQDD